MFTKKIVTLMCLIFSVVLLTGCNDSVNKSDDALSLLETEVYYLQKIRLPEGAKLEVRLEDVSKMDVAAEVISSAVRELKSSPPYALQIAFPSDQIKANHRYSLRASIRSGDELLFISTTHINPFEVGIATPIKIKVDHVQK
ncbi:hypothetical protein CW745_08175 [Psychromonas sp. psych-6C06]|uniref:YbaY family lipoprotein n=1 Tax=Psychromonas sp. psych-6C06 TaxID=2058089 RepID=UPI000C31CF26|nr:YbaY family lipoprotein [Psychromonas sp. psych-6C06]PKF61953.1 hypothetical protein CW745_08175 [Psychromonas sp. psych-6C06]